MDKSALLQWALEAQASGGPNAPVEVVIPRMPRNSTTKLMQLEHRSGPYGQIVAITTEGTVVHFEACRLILYCNAPSTTRIESRTGRVRIFPVVKRAHADRLNELAQQSRVTLSTLVDTALREYLERNLSCG